MRWLLGGFLIAHGFVHIVVWASQKAALRQGTRPDHSWLFGDQHSAVITVTYTVAGLFALAGGALILHMDLWRVMTVAGAALSLLLVGLFPEAILNAWIVAPVGIDVALVTSILWFAWPTKGVFAF
jgi:hypothetical protein